MHLILRQRYGLVLYIAQDVHLAELLNPLLDSLSDFIILLVNCNSLHFVQSAQVAALLLEPLDVAFDVEKPVVPVALAVVELSLELLVVL